MQLLWLFLLMALICSACKRNDFKSQHGLTSHRKKCKSVLPAATAMLDKRRQQLIRQAEKQRKEKEGGKKKKEDMADFEMDVPLVNEGDEVCCGHCRSAG